jgi:ubiquinone/menaquinone biosynthesis C-methylase UbiE
MRVMCTGRPDRTFTPAAGRDLFLPFYDPLMKLLGFDRLRNALIDQAALQPGHRVLDIGCGTGTLAIVVRQRHPAAEVVGLDPDAYALARARRKAQRAGAGVRFDQGFADALEYPDATFDRVFSSMMFHHLGKDQKDRALAEVRRVLKPGGRLEFLDFAQPGASVHGFLARLAHSHAQLRDNVDDRIVERMTRAGLVEARKVRDLGTLFGRVGFFQACAPRP